MSKIRIKNFGPIKEGGKATEGWVDIKKVTLFTGNQGSGKSTVAKLISSFAWMEKALVRGDFNKDWLEEKNRLKNRFLEYHRLENYFKPNTLIEYEGDAYSVVYRDGRLRIREKEMNSYALPQIMYVPAERNFVSYMRNPTELRVTAPPLSDFNSEFDIAKEDIKGSIELPINNVRLSYDVSEEALFLTGEDYNIGLHEASSGFQSFVPLYTVSKYLSESIGNRNSYFAELMSIEERKRFKKIASEILENENLTDEQKQIALSAHSSKFNKTAFVNIVEEPEQNLFPTSQKRMLYSLLAFNNKNEHNKLIATTHSPYLINYLTLAVKTGVLAQNPNYRNWITKLSDIVPMESTIRPENLVIYEMDDKDGSIKQLEWIAGIPSDENDLNEKLDESNELFARLLEIQQRI